jgi:hypothetical protein
MDRIQKVSSYLLIIFNILLVGLPVFEVVQWLFIDWGPIQKIVADGMLLKPLETPEGVVNLGTRQWDDLSKTIGLMAATLGLLPLFLSMFVLKSISEGLIPRSSASSYTLCHERESLYP